MKNKAKVNIDTSSIDSVSVLKLKKEIDALKLQRDSLYSKLCSSTAVVDRNRDNAIIGQSLVRRILTRMRAIVIKCLERDVKVDTSDLVAFMTDIGDVKRYFYPSYENTSVLEGSDIDMLTAITSAIDDLTAAGTTMVW